MFWEFCYRMRGCSTEEFIDTLNNKSQEEVDNEEMSQEEVDNEELIYIMVRHRKIWQLGNFFLFFNKNVYIVFQFYFK